MEFYPKRVSIEKSIKEAAKMGRKQPPFSERLLDDAYKLLSRRNRKSIKEANDAVAYNQLKKINSDVNSIVTALNEFTDSIKNSSDTCGISQVEIDKLMSKLNSLK